MFNRCAEKAGVEKKMGRAFHSLRRSFGTWLAKERVPITTISQLLGHADMDSGKPYLSFDDTQLSECAMDFSDIPLKRRIFNDIHGIAKTSLYGNA
jgi:integrase